MDRKMDPQKIDFWMILDRDRANFGAGRRQPAMASGLEIDEVESLFGTPRTPEGAAD